MTALDWIESHRRSILFLLALLVLGGAMMTLRLPVALFPQVDFPRVVVSLDAGDRPADRMAIEVTWPVEEAVRAVPGVVSIRSKTSRGSAEISVNFHWKQDMVAALLQVQAAINQVVGSLPPGVSFHVRRMDPTVFPVLAYSLRSTTHSLVELRDIALYQLRPLLSTVDGVSRVGVLGGAPEEYRVTVDPARLASYGLTLSDVARALSAANVVTAVGRLEENYKLYLVVSDTRLLGEEQVRATVLRVREGGMVLLDDVATVSREVVPQWNRVTADGRDAVIFQIYQQPGGNTIGIAKQVKVKLAGFIQTLPAGVRLANWYDQSELIISSAASVRDAVLIGVLLAAVVLFVFLRNWKVTLIAVITVPSVLVTTVLLLDVLHMSFNIMTLGGMAAAVGLIIDDAIVMVEHILRRLHGPKDHTFRGVMDAAREFTGPLAGSSISTIIIFAPLAFLSGVTGAFFRALSLTMAASLLLSFFIAWTVIPLLANKFLSEKDAPHEEAGPLTRKIHRLYEGVVGRGVDRPWLLLLILPLLVIGWIAYRHLGSGFMPSMDEGGFILDYKSTPGTSLTETDRLLRQVEDILRATPDVETYSRRTGLQLGGGLTEASEGDFFIRLKPFPRRPIRTVMDDVRVRVERNVPGLQIEMAQLMEDLIGDLTAVPQPVEIKIYSDDGALLRATGPRVAAAIQTIPGVVDVKNGIVFAGDSMQISVDRVRASLEGVDPESVTQLLAASLSGVVTTQIQSGPKMVGVRVWIPEEARASESKLGQLLLRAPDGHTFPLGRIATTHVLTGDPQIMRDNLKQMIAVTARISGRDMGSVVTDVKSVLAKRGLLPSNTYYALGGLYAEQQAAFTGLMVVFVSAVLLVFLLLLFIYETFRVALSILGTTLLAIPAVFAGLWISRAELNISSMMGLTMIIGIVTEVGIFYCSEFFSLEGMERREALIAAGKNRMRPIAMTTLAAILALAPLALGLGQGSAMQQPLAIAIVWGLAVQLPLVLVVLPVLLSVLRAQPR